MSDFFDDVKEYYFVFKHGIGVKFIRKNREYRCTIELTDKVELNIFDNDDKIISKEVLMNIGKHIKKESSRYTTSKYIDLTIHKINCNDYIRLTKKVLEYCGYKKLHFLTCVDTPYKQLFRINVNQYEDRWRELAFILCVKEKASKYIPKCIRKKIFDIQREFILM